MDETYDVVVVGAGPAGSRAAEAAARRGAKVLLIDQRQRIGVPVHCAEFVPQMISRYVPFSSQCVLQDIDTMVTHLPGNRSYEMSSPGYMLDRSLFDKELAASAVLAGARVSIETKAIGRTSEGVVVERGAQKEILRAKVIIGADGAHSFAARSLGYPPTRTIIALQYEVVNPHAQSHVDVFFHPDMEGGYAWFFPKGKTANVGVGILPRKGYLLLNRLNEFLRTLVDSKRLQDIHIIGKKGGAIPCEMPRQTVLENVLLAGDAACHAHPITGGGILNAVMAGEMAGRIAAQAVLRNDLGYLQHYQAEWREAFGSTLSYGASKRSFLEENWQRPGVDFEDLIRKTWVGFKEYYGERHSRKS